ncbi:hypothetical protein FPCIR_7307 [Fusarium pseudocircinatum]|uniref:Uncharacterized protein n=1 Tax=Fusarium pseudocircinatum TaxID=56676 RepID=A0A8H5LCE2_9HYPO|nr:hypothetical protein FPCIR_7307 [Fusarium pseudocircinatum]
MPSLRTQNRGTKRPPSDGLKTQESLKQDQLAHKCLRQVEDHKQLTQDSFNYVPTRNVDTKPFDYAISDFVAPLYHHKKDQWTVLCISFQCPRKENPGKGVVKAQHYDPDPCQHKGSVESVSFDVKRKLHDAALFISEQKLPALAALLKEIGDRRKELNEHDLVIKNKKEELERCQTKRASQVRALNIIDTEFSKLDDNNPANEKAAEEELAVLPNPTRKLNFRCHSHWRICIENALRRTLDRRGRGTRS